LKDFRYGDLVSVLIPVYNPGRYLRAAIHSVLQQTYKNIEIVIIDDGSTDNSLSFLKRIEESDDRVRLFARENRGLVTTLNEGVGLCKGAYIARMDADDICSKFRIEKQIHYALQTNADICGTSILIFKKFKFINRRQRYPSTSINSVIALCFGTCFAHPSVIYKKNIFERISYPEDSPHSEDYALWSRCADMGLKMMNLDTPLVYYRLHPYQVSSKNKFVQRTASDKLRLLGFARIINRSDLHGSMLKNVTRCFSGEGEVSIIKLIYLFTKIIEIPGADKRMILVSFSKICFKTSITPIKKIKLLGALLLVCYKAR